MTASLNRNRPKCSGSSLSRTSKPAGGFSQTLLNKSLRNLGGPPFSAAKAIVAPAAKLAIDCKMILRFYKCKTTMQR